MHFFGSVPFLLVRNRHNHIHARERDRGRERQRETETERDRLVESYYTNDIRN